MPTSRTDDHILRYRANNLPDDYYKQYKIVCNICYNDEKADCGLEEASTPISDMEANIRATLPTSTIHATVCRHVFHERCLTKWLQEQTNRRLHGNCSMCRSMLVFNSTAIACARHSEAHSSSSPSHSAAITQRRSRDDEPAIPSAFHTTHTQGDAFEREGLQLEEQTAVAQQPVINGLIVGQRQHLRELDEEINRLRGIRRTLLEEELLRLGEELLRLGEELGQSGEEYLHFIEEQHLLELRIRLRALRSPGNLVARVQIRIQIKEIQKTRIEKR